MNVRSPIALSLAATLAAGSVALMPSPAQSQPAPGQRGFWCHTSGGAPTTMYQNAQGNREPWIQWVSNVFRSAGYDPLTRCQEVSGRLETYRQNRQLKYLTVGVMNGQPVVCTASQVNGRCENLVFTLKPGQNAVRTLNNLLAWREGQAATPSLRETDPSYTPYIDVSARLGEDGPANPATAPSRSQPSYAAPSGQPAAPASPGEMREL
ncbi:hypothetical protein AMR42_12840 [Limnothrix sp. PR1529]|uniref:COP23 domain-containing protein n=1 Tax=Limnothrix sp. PR1529 TaxID=1704291 RepID=UPI00081DAFB6|nr:COP23 domain-containing protein [Limnothrix sp. PR1529]OCQ96456.1 hypothetical protein BCR12_11190 [Limnothrix sp. P13C2]PIB09246.1 hypothetical protein AMR42_12840 [Limnothrix sp. PR1529]